jgi:23S rRNA (guanosine2251-2'-O)-methyltransferase
MPEHLYGRNAVREALVAGRRRFFNLVLADRHDQSPTIKEIIGLSRRYNLPVERANRKRLDAIAHNHQGVMVEATGYPTVEVEDLIMKADELGEAPFLLALDHIEDPHNLGAILRSAESFGVHGVILPNNKQADVTPAVVKASVGASEHMLVAKVSNLSQTLNLLKKQEIWAVGLQHGDDSKAIHDADLRGPIVVVIGSEGDGMSRLVQETCDFRVEIPMKGKTESLNASVASALMLYETWRARDFEGSRS